MSHVETEFDVIGTALTSGNGCLEKILTLDPDDFTTPELSLIFRVMHDLHRQNEPLELMKIASGLKNHCDSKTLDTCLNYLAKIPIQKDYFESRMENLDALVDSLKKRWFDITKALRIGADLQTADIPPIQWATKGLVAKDANNLLSASAGVGKTTVATCICDSVSKGIPFLGLETMKMPVVYIDFENSLPVLAERVRRCDASQVLFWHTSNEIPPPRLDSNDYKLYKRLPEGALLVFDTLRASHTSDENSSQEMAVVMQRLKELRDCGFTILILHHTPKTSDRMYKGSSVICDLADHVLSFYKVKKGSFAEITDTDYEGDFCYRLGTQDKTRYEPFGMYLEFDSATKRFKLADDPHEEDLKSIAGLLAGKESLNQRQVCKLIKDEIGIKYTGKIVSLLKKGEGRYWKVSPTGLKNSVIYTLI